MHALLKVRLIPRPKTWQPGWRTGVAMNIAATTNVPARKRSNGDVWLVCALLLALAGLVVAL